MSNTHLATVRKVLGEYAERGVFGGFDEHRGRAGTTEFVFSWMYNRRYCVVFDERACTLKFKDFLPHLPSDSPVYASLKDFVKSRSDKKLPAHRRINTNRAEAKCLNRNSCASITLVVKNNQYTYGMRKLVNIAHEAFVMIDLNHAEYLYEHFDLPEE